MNYKGNASYQTPYGAILSILIVLVVGTYGVLRFAQMINHEQPQFIVNTVLKDMFNEFPEPFDAETNYFEFAVGFLSIKPYKFVEFDPRYG